MRTVVRAWTVRVASAVARWAMLSGCAGKARAEAGAGHSADSWGGRTRRALHATAAAAPHRPYPPRAAARAPSASGAAAVAVAAACSPALATDTARLSIVKNVNATCTRQKVNTPSTDARARGPPPAPPAPTANVPRDLFRTFFKHFPIVFHTSNSVLCTTDAIV
ncbi:hypothetical protein EVAR_43752_1 [Eumeta japonica]|uniref:Uncharacterized protein n=1 Tax=Eumeta variegata TaxID=151549 RepID=A0A4C1XKG2_EUMVA|nr:hypothetical protein EVAR_43752_1 [Eumeta japonica]